MYDPKSEPREFVGADRGEAVEKACRFFDMDEGELAISELEPEEVSGLAARALVVAYPRGRRQPPRQDDDGRDEGRRERGRDRDRGRREPRREGRGGGRSRRDGRREEGRGRERDREGPRREGRDRERGRPRRPAEPSEPSVGKAVGELSDYGRFVCGIVERMKLGPFEIEEDEQDDGDLVAIQLRGDAAVGLTTAETRVADAIQLLVNQVSHQGGREGPRVVVDVEGERERREEFLEQLASRACQRARSSGSAVALDPMNGKDRRTIHITLRDEDGIATMSVGEGRYRQVVVVPEGADEYEEALQAMEGAAREAD